MKLETKIFKASLILATSIFLTSTVYAAINVQGGLWSYGGHHSPNNWGAFSNYYHPSRYHWSSVTRHSDSLNDTDYASAGFTSMAFINTKLGEKCEFDYGF